MTAARRVSRDELVQTLAQLVADFAVDETHKFRPRLAAMEAALLAAKNDKMGCHSIAVWEQINAALAAAEGEGT
jgi:hypothetical protein